MHTKIEKFVTLNNRDNPAIEICFTTKPYEKWDELKKMLAKFDHSWTFRGQKSSKWSLQTSLETWKENNKDSLQSVYKIGNLLEHVEEVLLEEFKRGANNYFLSACQKPENTLEWLALMQHYGCPTRLLDFTYSPYVAAFFAFNDCYKDNATIWCFNADWCKYMAVKKYNEAFRNKIEQGQSKKITVCDDFGNEETFQNLWKNPKNLKMIFPVIPRHSNERLGIQQGLFLCMGSSQKFKSNIDGMRTDGEEHYFDYVLKIVISSKVRKEAIKDLNTMNINYASLFPGLEGYAKSLKNKIWIEERG